MTLTTTENADLIHYERIIERGMQTFIEVGDALMAIRDSKLYRTTHSTFEAYCSERWSISRSRAYQLISASKVAEDLSTTVDISNVSERVIRPLAGLPPDQQRQAWQQAEAESSGKPTAKAVQEAADEVAAFEDARRRFAQLGWKLERHGAWYKLTDADGSHYATTTDMTPHLDTLRTFEAGAAKRTAATQPEAPVQPGAVPDDIREHADRLGLLIQERDGGILLHWPWENTQVYDTQTLDQARYWLHEDAPRHAVEHAKRLGWQLSEVTRAGQRLFRCRHPDGRQTAEYANDMLAYGEALRFSGRGPAPTCDSCGKPATGKRTIGGLLAHRCGACTVLAESEDLQAQLGQQYRGAVERPELGPGPWHRIAWTGGGGGDYTHGQALDQIKTRAQRTAQGDATLRTLCERAETLGAIIDYTEQRADGRIKVEAPAGYQTGWVWCDAGELRQLCDSWERHAAPAQEEAPESIDWDRIARCGHVLARTRNEVEAREHLRAIGAALAQRDIRAYALWLLNLLAPLMAQMRPEGLEDLSQTISDLNECEQGSEGWHWIAVGWALLDVEAPEGAGK